MPDPPIPRLFQSLRGNNLWDRFGEQQSEPEHRHFLRAMVEADGGGIFCPPDSSLLEVAIFSSLWKDEPPLSVWITRIRGYDRAQYIADAVYYYTGSPPYHFKDTKLSFPPLQCCGRDGATTEVLTTSEMCSNYLRHIAVGRHFRHLRRDFLKRIIDVVSSNDFILQRQRFLQSKAVTILPPPLAVREVYWSLEVHLELAEKCLENVEGMTSVQFCHGLCRDLASKLWLAVQMARECVRFSKPDLRLPEKCYQSFKLLFRLSKEVESFKHHCCRNDWIQAAFMFTDATEYISSLGVDLDICREIFLGIRFGLREDHAHQITMLRLTRLFCERQTAAERVGIQAKEDFENLLTKLEAIKDLKEATGQDLRECQMVSHLLARLTMAPRSTILGTATSCSVEVDYDCLDPQELLGSGAAGDVRKTMWLGELFAEKVFYGSDHPSFKNEVSILGGLSHPNVVPMYCYAMDDRSCSIVMELMEEDLFHLMQSRYSRDNTLEFPFPLSEAIELMLQVADGMDYLHRKNIVHRDLKSRNILVKTAQGRDPLEDIQYVYAKVADFGLSKTKESSNTNCSEASNIGTIRWMAPELMMDHDVACGSDCDKVEILPFKIDVYSFGMVCYEILTGKVPFQYTTSQTEVRTLVLDGERPELPDRCPLVLKRLIERCWDSNVSLRPCFADICEELRYLRCLLLTGEEDRRSWTKKKEFLNKHTSTRDYHKDEDFLSALLDGWTPFDVATSN